MLNGTKVHPDTGTPPLGPIRAPEQRDSSKAAGGPTEEPAGEPRLAVNLRSDFTAAVANVMELTDPDRAAWTAGADACARAVIRALDSFARCAGQVQPSDQHADLRNGLAHTLGILLHPDKLAYADLAPATLSKLLKAVVVHVGRMDLALGHVTGAVVDRVCAEGFNFAGLSEDELHAVHEVLAKAGGGDALVRVTHALVERKRQAARTISDQLDSALRQSMLAQARTLLDDVTRLFGELDRLLPGDVQGATEREASLKEWRLGLDFAKRVAARRQAEAGEKPTPLPRPSRFGRDYTSGAKLGVALDRMLHLATGSTPARKLGDWLQDGHVRGPRWAMGAPFKAYASVTGFASSAVGGLVSAGQALVSNAADVAVHQGDASFWTKGTQEVATPQIARQARDAAWMARTMRVHPPEPAEAGKPEEDNLEFLTGKGYRFATRAEIPPDILAREHGGTGKVARLRYDEKEGHLCSDAWSALLIRVFVRVQNRKTTFHLVFQGTEVDNLGRIASVKSDAAHVFGGEDSAMREAKHVVGAYKAFIASRPNTSMHLVGHSLGGLLATHAAIAHEVPATTFNSLGMHVHTRDQHGAEQLDKSWGLVTHFNSSGDVVSQSLEGRRFGITAGSQPGRRVVIPNTSGHQMPAVLSGLLNVAMQQET